MNEVSHAIKRKLSSPICEQDPQACGKRYCLQDDTLCQDALLSLHLTITGLSETLKNVLKVGYEVERITDSLGMESEAWWCLNKTEKW